MALIDGPRLCGSSKKKDANVMTSMFEEFLKAFKVVDMTTKGPNEKNNCWEANEK